MDISAANRIAAVTAASGPIQATAAPAVGGNGETTDPLVARVAAEPTAIAAAGDGDTGKLGARRESGADYTAEERAELQRLRARDREVRAHEMAHLAAAGRHARGGASFTFEPGPDGRRYAVAGEVRIDTAEIAGDPAATLAKAQQVRRAALAPVDPSAQDRQIAAQAAAMAGQAHVEIARESRRSEDPTVSSAIGRTADRTYATTVDSDAPLIEVDA